MNFNNEGLIIEPCLSCEKSYVEDIWNEWCCDKKECTYGSEGSNIMKKDSFKIGDRVKFRTIGGWYNGGIIRDMDENSCLIEVDTLGLKNKHIQLPYFNRVLSHNLISESEGSRCMQMKSKS